MENERRIDLHLPDAGYRRIEEEAKRLTTEKGEKVNRADVIRLALERYFGESIFDVPQHGGYRERKVKDGIDSFGA